MNHLKPIFSLKVIKKPKKKISKKKRKKRKLYLFRINKVLKEKRDAIPVRWFTFEILKKNNIKLLNKFFALLIDVLILQKNSNLLKKKLKIYKRVLVKYITKQL